MSGGVYLNLCSKEIKLSSGSEPRGRSSQFCSKNNDIITMVAAGILAIFSILIAYGCIPMQNPMLATGMLAGAAEVIFLLGLLAALRTRGCIVVKDATPGAEQQQ